LVTPPQEPKALTRLWCTWELYNAIQSECDVHIHTSGKLYGDFQNILMKKKQFKTLITNLASKIDCVHAEASVSSHAVMLKTCIEQVGVEKVDNSISKCTKAWLASKGDEMVYRLLRSSNNDDNTKDRKTALDACSIVAGIWKDLGMLEKAEPSYRRVFELREELLGKDHLRTIKAMQNLASLLQQLSLNKTAKKGWNALSSSISNTNKYNNDANEKNYLAEAELLFRRALVKQEQILGLTDPQTLQSLNNFAVFCQKNQKLREAELLYRRALKGFEKAHGKMHSHTLQAGHNLASLLQEQGETMQAEEMYRSVYEGRVAVLGGEDPTTLQTLSRLGTVSRELGNIEEAESIFQQLVMIHKDGQGEQATETYHAMSMLASCMIDAQRLGEAEPLLRTVYEGRKNNFGINEYDTLQAASDLANLCYTTGNMTEAESLHKIAFEGRKELLGKRHLDTLQSITKLAAVYFAQSKLQDAETLYTQAYQGYKRKLGAFDSCTMLCVDMLARLLLKQNKFEAALPYYEQAFRHYSTTLGPSHPDTSNMMGCCGLCLIRLNRMSDGNDKIQKCLAELKNVKGTLSTDSPMIKSIDKRIKRFEKILEEGKDTALKGQQKNGNNLGVLSLNQESKMGGVEVETKRDISSEDNMESNNSANKDNRRPLSLKATSFGVMFTNRLTSKFTKPSPPLGGRPKHGGQPIQIVGRRGAPRGAPRGVPRSIVQPMSRAAMPKGVMRGVPRGVSESMSRAAMPNIAIRGNPRNVLQLGSTKPSPPPMPMGMKRSQSPSPRNLKSV
jgi:tetratricopeptide (TPR) repeat protein